MHPFSTENLILIVIISSVGCFFVFVVCWSLTKVFMLGRKHAQRKRDQEPPRE